MSSQIMGILNITPDSFHDGGVFFNFNKAMIRAHQIVEEGADLIDIGGCSTKPGSKPVSIEEEIKRVIPVIQKLSKEIAIPISVDTFRAEVAKLAMEAGASFINDISGFSDPLMTKLAVEYNASICVMHMQKDPQTMQLDPKYPLGVTQTILNFFNERIDRLKKMGIKENQIHLDPGIGFGKRVEDNYQIINDLEKFKNLGFPIVLGTSRKSFLQKTLKKDSKEVLNATLAINMLAIYKGVDILRVHDVAAHKDLIPVVSNLKEKKQPV